METSPGRQKSSSLRSEGAVTLWARVRRGFEAIDAALGWFLTPGVKFIVLVSVGSFIVLRAALSLAPEGMAGFVDRFLALNGSRSLILLYEFITYMFLHTGWLHLLNDIIMIMIIGPELETRWGESRFLRYFLSVGVGGALLYQLACFVLNVHAEPAMGFTNVLFGLLAAYGVYFPNRRFRPFQGIAIPIRFLVPAALIFGVFFLPQISRHISLPLNAASLAMGMIYLADYHRTWDLRMWRYLR